MKIVLCLLFCIVGCSSFSQNLEYSLSIIENEYEKFSDGKALFLGSIWGAYDSVGVPLGFAYNLDGEVYTEVYFECSGRLIFGPSHLRFVDVFTLADIQDAGQYNSQEASLISYRNRYSLDQNMLEIQVENAVCNGGVDSLSYTIKIYEEGTIEYVVGPNTFNQTNSYVNHFTGVYELIEESELAFKLGTSFYGSHDRYSDTSYSGLINPFMQWNMTGQPKQGTTLRLTQKESSVGTDDLKKVGTNQKIYSIKNRLFAFNNENVDVFDSSGRLMYSGELTNEGIEFNYQGLVFIITSKQNFKCVLTKF